MLHVHKAPLGCLVEAWAISALDYGAFWRYYKVTFKREGLEGKRPIPGPHMKYGEKSVEWRSADWSSHPFGQAP